MNNDFIVFLPNIILLILFILFLWRRNSLKNFDWATLICITLGVFLLAVVILLILNSQPEETSWRAFLIAAASAEANIWTWQPLAAICWKTFLLSTSISTRISFSRRAV